MNKLGLGANPKARALGANPKAREPQKLSRFQKFALVNVSESRTVKQALKAA